jgi:hypothetical protein
VGGELLVGLQLRPVPADVDSGSLCLFFRDEEGEGGLVVLAERIGVVLQSLPEVSGLTDVDRLVELGEEVDAGLLRDRLRLAWRRRILV